MECRCAPGRDPQDVLRVLVVLGYVLLKSSVYLILVRIFRRGHHWQGPVCVVLRRPHQEP